MVARSLRSLGGTGKMLRCDDQNVTEKSAEYPG